jgi:hypothetical protein
MLISSFTGIFKNVEVIISMNMEYKHNLDKAAAKEKIETHISKLEDMRFSGGYAIEDVKSYWTGDDLQVSFNLKKNVINRQIEGFIKVKNNLIIIDVEIPDIINNLVTEENLKKIISRNLENILNNVDYSGR